MDTLLLDTDLWDLCLDASGNIAMASNPYAIAQDVASACKLYLGELWYNTDKGIPYTDQILGHSPPLSLVKSDLETAALSVPEVVEARAVGLQISNGQLTGTIEFIDSTGQANNVSF